MTKMQAAYALERLLAEALRRGKVEAQLARARKAPRRSSASRLLKLERSLKASA